MFRNINKVILVSRGKFCTKAKTKPRPIVELSTQLSENLEKELLKPRQHPGIVKSSCVSLPEHITKAITKCTKDFPVKALCKEGDLLNNYIKSRKPPPEQDQIKIKSREIRDKVLEEVNQKQNVESLSSEQKDYLNKKSTDKIQKILKQQMYSWRAIEYDKYKALQYVMGRSAQEYAVLHKIFNEIVKRDEKFKPRSFIDFGSGVGTGIWAASNFWKENIYEYFLVDSSRDMNELSDLILRDGEENKDMSLRNVFYRQFLPASNTKYDIVMSAFTLFEMPSLKNRMEVVDNLLNKCDGYLIFVEHGSNAGFQLISEVRDYILGKEDAKLSIFSPCPHHLECPRMKLNDGTPCNFEVKYNKLPFPKQGDIGNTLYSYIVFRKGKHSGRDDSDWPRIIRPNLVRSKHSVCRMCTVEGKLQEIIFTPTKHGKFTYRCVRSSKWGDRLPIKIDNSSCRVDEDEKENV